ncbi:3-deoxy-D-manno-octulosonate 8-phosphate phosphatase [hydrothermal vent metagenome]|uniref:3-deoxy-D-manno-octulosonate 8-phosphate phosphatase n=1 Tax=hydrothermal vent metagenome TaxID=652676 RepID=A0A3B1CYW9_9ZZZZ
MEMLLRKISLEEFKRRAGIIKLLILDVDGVMTDGRIIYTSEGSEIKNFDVKDGHGIVLARDSGIEIAIISGRESAVTRRRAEDLEIKFVYQGVKEKEKIVNRLLDKLDIDFDQVAFLGDDVIDIAVMNVVGIGAAVADAHPKALEMACWITKKNGGRGAVRELIDAILEAQA